jgi:hypothetical protein
MGYRCSEFDVTHAFTANFGPSDFYAASVTDNTLITNSLIFPTVTFPVFSRSKNAFAKEPVFFWL